MADNEEIVRLASLMLKDEPEYADAIKFLRSTDLMLVQMAASLLDNKSFGVSSDNPESIARCRSLAHHIGASVESGDDPLGTAAVIFYPPLRH
jgi:hypothetical protein